MKTSLLKMNPSNPRRIQPDKLEKLCASIKALPQMMALRPIVYDPETMHVLGGNQRLAAIRKLGMKDIPDEWAIAATDLTPEQQKEFVLRDNVQFGDWDIEMLSAEFAEFDLDELGLDMPEIEVDGQDKNNEKHASLSDTFLVPPFSVLDTRQGYWQERKERWKALINDNGEARMGALCFNTKTIAEIKSVGNTYDKDKIKPNSLSNGVSILDPVLAEIACKWFGLDNCQTFDCFAGDTVFGYVSAHSGNNFIGIELRQEQCDFNNEKTQGMSAKYICDDAQNVLKHIPLCSQDLLFSCPPYFDLEVYSSLVNDASNQKEYASFIGILEKAFTDSIKCLKNNRFAFIVVGDVRGKNGEYMMFPDDVKRIFTKNGMILYNELVLIEQIGTLPQRVAKSMVNRKVGKCHQNVLVFYKGNTKDIKIEYPKLEIEIAGKNI